MGCFEDRFVYQAHWYEYVLDWILDMDIIFNTWKGDSISLQEFINHLNNAAPSINFTHEISKSQVNFLDATITKKENDVETHLTYIRNRQTLILIFTGLRHTLPT